MASEKEHINNLRFKGLIKGNRPFICLMTKSTNYFKKLSMKYIISYKNDTIYFQSLNYFNEMPNSKKDHEIKLSELKSYFYNMSDKYIISFDLITKSNHYINLVVNTNVKSRIHSQVVFKDFIKYLEDNNILDEDKMLEEDNKDEENR